MELKAQGLRSILYGHFANLFSSSANRFVGSADYIDAGDAIWPGLLQRM